jgi:hypothetical protein
VDHRAEEGLAVKQIPIYDASAPIVCTIGSEEIPERIELVDRMRERLGRIERTEHGLLLHYAPDPGVEADLRRFALDEKRCCRFWGFAVDATASELVLRWDGPPDAGDLLDQLLASFEGDTEITAISGLL